MKIYRAAAFAAKIGVHKNTVKAWSLNGKLPDRRTPAGHRYYTEADVERYFGVERAPGSGRTVVYCRVSNRAQGDDLRSQQQAMETFCLGAGLAVDEWLTEIGGGLDFQRPVFRALMERIGKREPGLLLVAHEDRLCRFGFDWFAYFAESHGCEIRVVNQPGLSLQAEWVEDLMAVVDTFSDHLPGLRRYRKQIREAAKVPVKKAIRHRTRGNSAERERLYSLLKQNRWDEDPFLHRQMRKQWRGGRSHVTNQIVADAGSYTTKVWHDRAWVYLQGLERGQRIAIPLKGTHLPSGTLRILLRDHGQVEVHYAVDETQVCSTRPCGAATVGADKGYTEAYTDSDGARHGEDLGDLLSAESDRRKVKGTRRNHLRDTEQKHRAKGHYRKANNIRKNNLGNQKWDRRRTLHRKQVRDHLCQAAHTVVDKAGTIACEDLSAHMKSAPYRHRDTNRRLSGWVKGAMADTLTSISRRRGSAPALVNPAYTSQIDSRTGLLQGRRRWDRFYCLDGVVLDADVNAACNILARLYDEEITLYMPYRDVRALLAERTRTAVGTAPPGLELRGLATMPPSTESELPEPVPKCTR